MAAPHRDEGWLQVMAMRWRLIQSYARARERKIIEPVGLIVVVDVAYARTVSQALLQAAAMPRKNQRFVTCLERDVVLEGLTRAEPELASELEWLIDRPGRFSAVVLADEGYVVTGTWQELFELSDELAATHGSTSPSRRRGGAA